MNTRIAIYIFAASLLLNLSSPLHAQSEAASDLSMAPVALSVTAPASVLVAGTVLTVKSIQASAKGAIIVLEGVADASHATIEVSGDLAAKTSVVVGKAATVSVVASGTIISAAGQVLAFIPSEIGRELLHNEKIAQ